MKVISFAAVLLLLLTSCDSSEPQPDDPGNVGDPGNGGGRIEAPASAPSLSIPQNGASNRRWPITFSWTAVQGATSYELYAWNNFNYNGQTRESSFVNEKSIRTNSFTSGSNYSDSWRGKEIHWKVRAKNATGTGPWSAAYTFTLRQ